MNAEHCALTMPQDGVKLAEWASRYATSSLPVLPLHTIRDDQCACRTDTNGPPCNGRPPPGAHRSRSSNADAPSRPPSSDAVPLGAAR